MGEKCAEFKRYLHSSGVINALNDAIGKLYDLDQKPENPLKFLIEQLTPNGTKALADAQATIEILKNGRDLDQKDPNSIQKAIEKLQADDNCKSLLKEHLKNKEESFDKIAASDELKQQLFDCVKIGLVDHKQDIGLIAADSECYTNFSEIFKPIIEKIHGKLPKNPFNPSWEYDVSELVKPSIPFNDYIQRAVITCRRSLPKIPFQVKMTSDNFSKVRESVIESLKDQFKDTDLINLPYKFEDLGPYIKADLLKQNLIFDESEFDETLKFVGATKYWPVGRMAFIADDKSYVIWVNRIDHLEFKSFNKDVKKAIEKISTIGKTIDEKVSPFKSESDYGWITCSPKYIGNAMTVSIFIKLTKLSGQALDKILDKHELIIISNEVADEGSKIYEIQNKSSLCTQKETIEKILEGIAEIIENEMKN